MAVDMIGGAGSPQSRRVVAGMGRAELEDKQLGLLEENHLLKKHARSQEEKMKKMATKLLKLAEDERREARRNGQPPSVIHVRELEGEVQELVSKIRDLERTNSSLHNKVAVLKQQCENNGRRRTAYDHVQSRISCGLGRRGQQRSVSTEDVSLRRGNASAHFSPTPPRYGRSLLDEARRDNQELEELVLKLKQEVSVLTAQAEKNQEQMRLQAADHEHQRLSLQQQLQAQSTAEQKRGIEEDVEVIRVQRELREKSDRLLSLQTQFSALEKNLEAMRTNHSNLLQEIELLNGRLKEEQTHSVELRSQLHSSSVSHRTVVELQEVVDDLRAEKDLLKKANDRLMKSALMEDRGEYRGQVRALQERIRELETAQQTHLTANAHAVHTLSSEREVSEQLERELRETREAYHLLQSQYQLLKNRLQNEVKEGLGSSSELRGGLGTLKDAAVNTDAATPVTADPLCFLEKLDHVDLHRELSELRLSHVDTAAELEKTRQLLAAQRTINQDYKKEVDTLRSQMSRLQSHHSTQLSEQSQLLDVHAARVRQLESKIRDMPYDTGMRQMHSGTNEEGHQHSPPLHSGHSPLSPPSSHTPPQPTLHTSQLEQPSHPHSRETGALPDTNNTNARGGSVQGGYDDTDDAGGLGRGGEGTQERGRTKDEEKQRQKKRKQIGGNKIRGKGKKGGRVGRDYHPDINPEPGGGEERDTHLHAQPRKPDQSVTVEAQPKEGARAEKTAVEVEREAGKGFSAHQLPPLRTAGGKTSSPAPLAQTEHSAAELRCEATKNENLHDEAKDRYTMRREKKHDLDKTQGAEDGVGEEEDNISVSSSSNSSSGMGTPSTSTPLRPVHTSSSSSGGGSGRQGALPPPPLSSSLSAIAEPLEAGEREGGWVRGDRVAVSGGGGGFVMMGGGEEEMGSGEDGDSVSVTVTEMSEEGDEDTMFEETLPQHTTESIVSDRTIPTPTQPSVRLASDNEEDSPLVSSSLTLTSGDEGNPITLTTPQPKDLPVQTPADTMSITIVSFTVEPGSSLTDREDISGYFVEFQLLDYDYGELETPSVFTAPHSTQPVIFNFKKDFHVGPTQKALLSTALSPTTDSSDGRVVFTVVSDPVDQEGDCDEVGTAELDLSTILHQGEDIINENIEVLSHDEVSELIGHLSVSVHAVDVLQRLV